MVHHLGALSSGHYVASVKSQATKKWHYFNDDQARQTVVVGVACGGGGGGNGVGVVAAVVGWMWRAAVIVSVSRQTVLLRRAVGGWDRRNLRGCTFPCCLSGAVPICPDSQGPFG